MLVLATLFIVTTAQAEENYYEFLGVSQTASRAEIKTASSALMKQYHPDRNEGDRRYEDKLAEVINASKILLDTNSRKTYDVKLITGSIFDGMTRGQLYTPPKKAFGDWRDMMPERLPAWPPGFMERIKNWVEYPTDWKANTPEEMRKLVREKINSEIKLVLPLLSEKWDIYSVALVYWKDLKAHADYVYGSTFFDHIKGQIGANWYEGVVLGAYDVLAEISIFNPTEFDRDAQDIRRTVLGLYDSKPPFEELHWGIEHLKKELARKKAWDLEHPYSEEAERLKGKNEYQIKMGRLYSRWSGERLEATLAVYQKIKIMTENIVQRRGLVREKAVSVERDEMTRCESIFKTILN